MLRPRIIPCLLYFDRGLVKTVRFRDPSYVGDPINTARIFNDRGADELVLLDIRASARARSPDFEAIRQIASECFMPFTYGGGIKSAEQVKKLLALGAEKVAINTAAVENPDLISVCARRFGRQSVVVSIDVKRDRSGRPEVFVRGGRVATGLCPTEHAVRLEEQGAGEIFLNSIDRDGTYDGYDIALIREVASAVRIPVIACGGARGIEDFRRAVSEGGASGAAAGSVFVFFGRKRAVLVSYPDRAQMVELFV